MIAALAFLKSVPRWAWIALAFAIAAVLFGVWLADQKRDAVEADRAESRATAVETAREADQSAHEAAQGKSDAIEAANRSAAEAAAKSDDPLRAALDDLREQKR